MTDDRKCDSPERGVKGIRDVSQLTERCERLGERCKEVWEGVTVVRKCDRRFLSGELLWSWGTVRGLEEVHHLTGRVTVNREV